MSFFYLRPFDQFYFMPFGAIEDEHGQQLCSKEVMVQVKDMRKQWQKSGMHLTKGDSVGICCEHGSLMEIIVLLAVWELGAVIVPMNVDHVEEYIQLCRVSYVVGMDIVSKDYEKIDIGLYQRKHPIKYMDEIAWAIVTSGSVARKVVCGTKANLMARLSGYRDFVDENVKYRTFRHTKLYFVDALREIFGALWYGGTLVLHGSQRILHAEDYGRLMLETQSNRICMIPEYAMVIPATYFANMQLVELSGQAMNVNVWEHFQNADVDLLLNIYGMTEVTGDIMVKSLKSNTKARSSWKKHGVPIGVPFRDCKVELINTTSGVGELVVCGPVLAKGYLTLNNQIEDFETANSRDSEEQYFPTGDLCIYVDKGSARSLHFVDRADCMANVNGIRISTFDVENRLREHFVFPVHVFQPNGKSFLVGVMFNHSEGKIINSIPYKRQAMQILPTEMVPALFIVGKYQNGSEKMTRSKLNAIFQQYVNTQSINGIEEKPLVLPRDRVYQALCKTCPTFSLANDEKWFEYSFLQIAGTSLDAMQFIFYMQKKLQCTVDPKKLLSDAPLKDLFPRIPHPLKGDEVHEIAHKKQKRESSAWSYLWKVDCHKCIDARALLIRSNPSRPELVVVGSHFGILTCVVSLTGAMYWTCMLQDRIESSAIYSPVHDLIFVGCYAGNIYAVHAASGAILWQYSTKSHIKCPPAIHNNHVWFGSYDHHLYRIQLQDGLHALKLPIQGSMYAAPVISKSNSQLYAATTVGDLYCWSLTSHPKILWQYKARGGIFSTPLVLQSNKYLIFGITDGSIQCITPDGIEVYHTFTTQPIFTSPIENPKQNTIYIGSHDSIFRCIDATSGKVLWQVQLDAAIFSSPVFLSPIIYVFTIIGTLYYLHFENGTIMKTKNAPGCIYASPIAHQQKNLIVGCRNNFFYHIEVQ